MDQPVQYAPAQPNRGNSGISSTPPDYAGLVSFLVKPFLETPDTLRVDCETAPGKPRVWIRVAFQDSDKGRVFGRGGRNIQAIRTVLEAAAQAAGQTAYLDIFGGSPLNHEGEGGERSEGRSGERSPSRPEGGSRRPSPSRPSLREHHS